MTLGPNIPLALNSNVHSERPDNLLRVILHGVGEPTLPHEVAVAIAELIARPKGKRPIRTVVGAPFGADVGNAQTAPVQSRVVEALGLRDLAALV